MFIVTNAVLTRSSSNLELEMITLLYATLAIYYDCPSGLSELRPARSISSVDSKFTAMTELRT